ncbi:hypothetical protein ACNQO9_07155 [Acinetobacter calcoaceticus]
MFKNTIIRHTEICIIVILSTLIIYALQLFFPKNNLVETYFTELTISTTTAIISCLAIIIKLLINIFKIELPSFYQRSLTFFIEKTSICFISIFGFCIAMSLINIIYGNYQIILLYIVLGIFGLIYGSAAIFLNIKLQIKGYLT